MQVSRRLWESQAKLMAADVTLLANVTPPEITLIAAPFTPSMALEDPASLTFADFPGSDPKAIGAGTQGVFYDQVTGSYVLMLKEPAGGWTWIATGDPVDPQTIYGFALVTADGAEVLGSQQLSNPIGISEMGQAIVLPNIRLTFSSSSPN